MAARGKQGEWDERRVAGEQPERSHEAAAAKRRRDELRSRRYRSR